MNLIRRLIPLLLLSSLPCAAEGPDAPANPPDVLLKMIQAVESSKTGGPTSRLGESGGTYHLRDAHFLGTVTRDGRTYTFGWLKFIRSRPADRETPPARGHDFIVVLDPEFKLVSHGEAGMGPYRIEGDRLIGDGVDVDLQSKDPLIRRNGFLIGGQFLEYPFPDRITDEEWESGKFKRSN